MSAPPARAAPGLALLAPLAWGDLACDLLAAAGAFGAHGLYPVKICPVEPSGSRARCDSQWSGCAASARARASGVQYALAIRASRAVGAADPNILPRDLFDELVGSWQSVHRRYGWRRFSCHQAKNH
jgi:hypothetical protein